MPAAGRSALCNHSPASARVLPRWDRSADTSAPNSSDSRSELSAAKGPKPPEHIQVVHALPRDAGGKPRTEILQLVAMNQLDLIEPMMASDTDRAFLKDILDQRKNLRDRFNFEAGDLQLPSG